MSKKQIRPLAAYKKAHPEKWEKFYSKIIEGLKGKSRDNEIYWFMGFANYMERSDDITKPDPFFHSGAVHDNLRVRNRMTAIELGQLYLHCWYYDIEEFGEDMAKYIKRSYHRKTEKGEKFNDSEFANAVRHIRDNIGHYYYNQNAAKLYILETFFSDEVKPLLPEPPEIVKEFERGSDFLNRLEKAWIKKDPDYFKNRMYFLESYVEYLQGILDYYPVSYDDEHEYKSVYDQRGKEYIDKLNNAHKEHRAAIISELDSNKQLTQILR